jgi:Protein of unknown function (DUF3592)
MLAGIFVLVIAVGALAAGVGYVKTARRMRGFQTARGRITSREVYDDITFPNQEAQFGDSGGYRPKYTYAYEVAGKAYNGDKLSYATRGYKKSVVEQKIAAMPEEVDVHYNPDDPSEAYLETNSTTLGWFCIAIGIVLALGALVGIVG